MKKTMSRSWWWGTLAVFLTGCTKNFDAINTNPNNVTAEMLKYDNLFVGGFIVQMEKNVFPVANQPSYGDEEYQIVENLAGDVFSGHMGASNNWFGGSNNTTYDLIPSWYGAAFDRAFTGVMSAWFYIRNNVKPVAPDVYAVAQIIKVASLSRTTDMYGPLPYLKFGSSGLQTDYDSQQAIYSSFFSELDSARTVLEDFVQKYPGARPLIKYDMIYGGDYTHWVKLANSLKLRLAMRIVYADASLAQKEAEDAVKDSYGVMTANTDNALLQSYNGITIHNPLEIITDNFNDIRMGATMESFLKGYSDPRIGYMFKTSALDGNYHGIRTGIAITDRTPYTALSKLNLLSTSPVPWMKAAEPYFLRAEGALRGWDMGATAESLYQQGVTTSFAEWGAGDPTAYLADNSSVQAAYTDVVNGSNSYNGSLSTITIQWNESDGFEARLERILTQKWIALYPDGQEAWSEFRRTGYPKVFPVLVNNSQGTIGTDVQIRRLPFPSSEYLNNHGGVLTGVSLLGGNDNGGTKLWWDKK